MDEKIQKQIEQLNDINTFKIAILNSSEHVIIADSEGTILFANNAAAQITGYSIEEMIGKKAGGRQLWGGHMDEDFYKKLWQTIKVEKKVFSGIIKNRRKNGEYYSAQASISPVLNEKGEVIYFIGNEKDITKELEVDKMKNEFISITSHQLKTPITRIKLASQELLDDKKLKLDESESMYLNAIKDSDMEMLKLVNALLDIAKLEAGKIIIEKKDIDLKTIVESSVTALIDVAKQKNQNITTEVRLANTQISADERLLKEVYKNLISNAVKYTPEKGEIKVIVEEKDGMILSTVSDTGMGIPEEEKPKMFEKFFRAYNAQEKEKDGSGLGLYFIKQVIERMGGEIWFESKMNKGTKFYFKIPKV